MDDTRTTLLMRLRDRTDETAWSTFDRLYRSMLIQYTQARGLDLADAEDVAQQCVTAVMEQIDGYAHRASFKNWLYGIAEHKIVDLYRRRRRECQPADGVLTNAEDSSTNADGIWHRHWMVAHLRHCAESVRREVAESTYLAFERYAIQGHPVSDVAASLGLTPNQVYVAKHRVLARIREMMVELTGVDETEFRV